MPTAFAVTPLLVGEPTTAVRSVTSPSDIVAALGIAPVAPPVVLALGPRVRLIAARTATAHPALRWVALLPEAPGSVEAVVVCTASLADSASLLRIAGRLRATLRDPRVVERACDARTREELVRALRTADDERAEAPLAADDILRLLGGAPHGLTSADAAERLAEAGPNRLERVRRAPLGTRFLEQFTSFFAVLLWVAAAFAILARLPELGIAIVVVILVNGIGSFLQEYRAERALAALEDLLPHTVTVLRDGAAVRRPATDVVPGDVVHGEEGDQIPADGQLLDADGLRVDHAELAVYPFDSFRKRMSIVRAADGGAVAYVKGAPRETLALCTTIRWDGTLVPLTDAHRRAALADHDRLAVDGFRLLALAERPIDGATVSETVVERELTLVGFVALWDPPRPDVPDAIALCERAGLRIIMVTGDYGLTARAIAARIGMDVRKIVTGEELERMPAGALRRLLREPGLLFARASPAHKLAIVEALRALGEVVAVTGDGVNDAPALKAADIGVAMGRRGTDVAREAAEIVLTDDNFVSIVTAIEQGRAIYANMGKFVTYIFASNVPELVPFLAFVFLGIPLPLTVMQILAVDLGTDLVPALALGAEPPERGVMDRPPRPRHARLLDAGRLVHAYAFLGAIEAALALGGFFWVYWLAGWQPGLPMDASGELYQRATTMTLAGIVAAQVGNVFACRTDRDSVLSAGFAANRLVFAGVVVEVAVLVALIETPPLARLFGLAPLAPAEWAPLLGFPFVILGCEELRKWFVRTRPRGAAHKGDR